MRIHAAVTTARARPGLEQAVRASQGHEPADPRACAVARGARLADLADDVVGRRLRFDPDPEPDPEPPG
ncbi:MAG: hypothetical protein M3Y33_07800 [Actinomycetota bacterium]|nr:hypothetical protein [Actinomycetota bacterium]